MWIFIGIITFITLSIVTTSLFSAKRKKEIALVLKNSQKIDRLKKLNKDFHFCDPKNEWKWRHVCRSRAGYRNCDFEKAEKPFWKFHEKEVISSFHQLAYNQSKIGEYLEKVEVAKKAETVIDFDNLKIKPKRFLQIEEEEFEKLVQKPKLSAEIWIGYEYTSPAGQSHSESEWKKLTFNDFSKYLVKEMPSSDNLLEQNDAPLPSEDSASKEQSDILPDDNPLEHPENDFMELFEKTDNFLIKVNCTISILNKFVPKFEYFDTNIPTSIQYDYFSTHANPELVEKANDLQKALLDFDYFENYEKAISFLQNIKDYLKNDSHFEVSFDLISKEKFDEIIRVFKAKFFINCEGTVAVLGYKIGTNEDIDGYLTENPGSVFFGIISWIQNKLVSINSEPLRNKLMYLKTEILEKSSKNLIFDFVETVTVIISINLSPKDARFPTVSYSVKFYNQSEISRFEAFVQTYDQTIYALYNMLESDIEDINTRKLTSKNVLLQLAYLKERYSVRERVEIVFSEEILKSSVWFEYFNLRPEKEPVCLDSLPKGELILNDALANKMRQYQIFAFEWCNLLVKNNLSGILADDMGLGKTLEIISVLEADKTQMPNLIICPTSLIYNWSSEFKKWTPEEHVKTLRKLKNSFLQKEISFVKMNIIVTYNFLIDHIDELKAIKFNYIVLDEAQYIKNSGTLRSSCAKMLESNYRFALTGTPIENHEDNLWSIFDFLMPDLFQEYKISILSKEVKKEYIKPFMLRRRKQDVLSELPPKNEIIVPLEMGQQQRDFYETYKNTHIDISDEYMHIFAELTRLRQICVDTRLIDSSSEIEAVKYEYLDILLETIISNNENVLVYSFFSSVFDFVEVRLKRNGIEFVRLDGSISPETRPQIINEFDKNERIHVFLISLKAGGVGLNLTKANNVIFLDPWWNTAVENQAADRTHRIGQNKTVTVYRLICQDTIEERVMDIQKQKQEVINYFIEDGGAVSGEKLTLNMIKHILK